MLESYRVLCSALCVTSSSRATHSLGCTVLYSVLLCVDCAPTILSKLPTCNGAFVRINIYLSCSLSCCSCCALSRRFWRSSPGRQRYESDSKRRFFSETTQTTTTTTTTTTLFPPILLKCMTPCWVSLHVWCGVCPSVCLGKKPPVVGWLHLSMSQWMNFIVTFTASFTWHFGLHKWVFLFFSYKWKENTLY